MKKSVKTVLTGFVLTSVVMTSACGYLLYPERQGQRGGRLDATVVLLDAAGLLFGVIPGVVAFAVDIATGTIYLPHGGQSALDKHADRVSMMIPEGDLVPDTGNAVKLDHHRISDELSDYLGQAIDASEIQYFQAKDGSQLAGRYQAIPSA